ncbi:MAG: ABC transporter permease [Planctomycetota bacterium]
MQVIQLALKDLKLLLRDRTAAFFILAFPVLMGVFFGLMMGGTSESSRGKIKLAVVDQDGSELSRKFISGLERNKSLELSTAEFEPAREQVRKAEATGMLVIPQGFAQNAGIFWEPQPELQLGVDPARAAEGAMLEGFTMQAMAELIQYRIEHPADFLPSLAKAREVFSSDAQVDPVTRQLGATLFRTLEQFIGGLPAGDGAAENANSVANGNDAVAGPSIQLAKIHKLDVTSKAQTLTVGGETAKLRSQWDISFPQAMLWGVLGCAAGFASSIARERSYGTLQRLLAAPLGLRQILLGKALACLLASILVIALLTLLGLQLGMRPESFPKLAVAGLCTAICFSGIMMIISNLGKSEQSVSGVGWSLNLVMAMLGGCMIPVMFMPAFVQQASVVSPVRWAILAIEGAVWRGFSWGEILPACAVLLGIGALGFAAGTWLLSRASQDGGR